MADPNPVDFSDAPANEYIELPGRYIEVGCPRCDHVFEIDLIEWVPDAQR